MKFSASKLKYSASTSGPSATSHPMPMKMPAMFEPTAWLFGNEAHGLPEDVIGAAVYRVSIPIHGSAESLNLATAAAMCMWETSMGIHAPEE